MSKKGQITLFMVLGLVILFIFGFVLILSNSSTDTTEVEEIYADFLKSVPVKEYATLCIGEATKEGLRLLGNQGGKIYNHQANATSVALAPIYHLNPQPKPIAYGYYVIPYNISGRWYNVSFGIKDRISYPFTGAQNYPYIDLIQKKNVSLLVEPNLLIPTEDPFLPFSKKHPRRSFGYLNQLCDCEGLNKPGSNVASWSCETYDCEYDLSMNLLPVRKSMQDYLQLYIKNKTLECLNISIFRGYNIKVGKPVVSSVIGDTDVSVHVNLPLLINVSGKVYTETLYFYKNEKVRLKLIHELATRLIRDDAKNIFFVPEVHTDYLQDCRLIQGSTKCLRDGMSVTRIRDPGTSTEVTDRYGHDNTLYYYNGRFADIINITDTESELDGKPYSFFYAIENRRPALDLMHETEGSNYDSLYDFVVYEGTELLLEPWGFDPDGDSYGVCKRNEQDCMDYTYQYTGWKAEYEQDFIWDSSGNITGVWLTEAHNPQSMNFTLTNRFDPHKHNDPYISERFFSDYQAQQKFTCRYPSAYPILSSICSDYGNKWETSKAYTQTNRVANYTTNSSDVGPHVVNITIIDNNGLMDWQLIRILVYNVIGPGHPGTDAQAMTPNKIENIRASVEDPYTFKITPLNTRIDGTTHYTWKDYDESPNPRKWGPFADSNGYAVQQLLKNTDNPIGIFTSTGTHNIKLAITNPLVIATFNVEVYNCLPYRNPNSAPYPFNRFAYDLFTDDNIPSTPGFDPEKDFLADHICCSGIGTAPGGTIWGTLKFGGLPCYTFHVPETCGPPGNQPIPPADLVVRSVSGKQLQHIAERPSGIGATTTSPSNAVYVRTFTQACSGSRGNACSGTPIDDWRVKFDCDTRTPINTHKQESCQGIFGTATQYNTCMNDVKTTGKPSASTTFPADTSQCHLFDAGESWEKNVLGTGNGICHKEYKCTKNPGAGDGYKNPGTSTPSAPYTHRCQAGCSNGGCTAAINCVQCPTKCIPQSGDDVCI